VHFSSFKVKEGETTPPKRYTTGSMILAMENAGNLIEDEELREQIKSRGIGTSATRAEILKKLVEKNHYLSLNKKTQVLTPTLFGEMVTDCVAASIGALLSPSLTASWEKGLSMVSEGALSADEYMKKLSDFIKKNVNGVKEKQNSLEMLKFYEYDKTFYGKEKAEKEKDVKEEN
ncbi:MAG: type IA DNA topoisomerase, partial [Lachnospiraceae bacterium]|nr:type IA DNA topoisomerase [Lachnospiraceae bacterium]